MTYEFNIIQQTWDDCDKFIIIEKHTDATVFVYNYMTESWICSLYVPEAYRHNGIATALLNECEKYVTHFPVDIAVNYNAPEWLVNFYEKRKYKITKNEMEQE